MRTPPLDQSALRSWSPPFAALVRRSFTSEPSTGSLQHDIAVSSSTVAVDTHVPLCFPLETESARFMLIPMPRSEGGTTQRWSVLSDHFDHCFIVFKNVQLGLALRRICVCGDVVHVRQSINISVSLLFEFGFVIPRTVSCCWVGWFSGTVR